MARRIVELTDRQGRACACTERDPLPAALAADGEAACAARRTDFPGLCTYRPAR